MDEERKLGQNPENQKQKKYGFHCTISYQQGMSLTRCFLANLLVGGLTNSNGVLYTYMQNSLEVSEYDLSWIGSIMTGLSGFSSVLAALMVDISGCRFTSLLGPFLSTAGLLAGSQCSNIYLLYFTISALPGIGVTLTFIATSVHVNRTFTKWRPFAVGISVSGIAIGVLVWPLLTSLMAESFGWRGALLINGALVLELVPFCLTMETKNHERIQRPDSAKKNKNSCLGSVLNFRSFFKISGSFLTILVHLLFGMSLYTFPTFIPSYVLMTYPDVTKTDSALILSLSGLGNLLGRVLFACASIAHAKVPQYIFTSCLCLCGIINLTVPLSANVFHLYLNGAVYGLCYGGFASCAPLMYIELFGLKHVSQTLGCFNAAIGLGSLVGPPIQSVLATTFGSQDIIFFSSGICFIMSSVVSLLLLVMRCIWPQYGTSTEIKVEGVYNKSFDSSEHQNQDCLNNTSVKY